jgi:hypothetical protein
MALTASLIDQTGITPVTRRPPGSRYLEMVEIPLDNSYPTGGYSLAVLAGLLGWQQVTRFIPTSLGPSITAGIGDFSYDKANNKVKLYTAAGAEVANATDVSASKLYGLVEGI